MTQTQPSDISAERQGDLFDDFPPAVDTRFITARRIDLDETSWIEHVPGWLQGSGALFEELLVLLRWKVEVAVDITTLETQVQDAVFGIVCRRCQEPALPRSSGDLFRDAGWLERIEEKWEPVFRPQSA